MSTVARKIGGTVLFFPGVLVLAAGIWLVRSTPEYPSAHIMSEVMIGFGILYIVIALILWVRKRTSATAVESSPNDRNVSERKAG